MKCKPTKPTEVWRITPSEASRLTGYNSRHLGRLATEGVIKAPLKGYEVLNLLEGLCKYLRSNSDVTGIKEKTAQARLRKIEADASKAELELEISRGEVLRKDEFATSAAQLCTQIKERLNFVLIDRIPATNAGLDAGRQRENNRQENAEFCKTMQEWLTKWDK